MAENPLLGPIPREIPLPRAPLHRVVAQVRFPTVAAVAQREFIASFQEEIRAEFPVLREEHTQSVVLADTGPVPLKAQPAWRFAGLDKTWRVSLTPEFIALETTAYASRTDFLDRLRRTLIALEKHIKPSLADRLGIRYIDRITGDPLASINKLVRAELQGIAGTPLEAHVRHALSENVFLVEDRQVIARWGRLPGGATVDPGVLDPISETSWIIDLDMSSTSPAPFNVEQLISEARRFAERLYAIFRWVVTDEFLRMYGGNP